MFEPVAAQDHFAAPSKAATRRVKRRERLFVAGEPCRSIYAVRRGFFKTCMVDAAGREQIVGFHMKDDVLGMDGLASERHAVDAIALEDSDVQILPHAEGDIAPVLAREVARQQAVIMVLGTMNASERLAAFLGDLSRRFAGLGYSSTDFHLRMTRAEIASFLGLKLETVSRLFSEFERSGLVEVAGKHVRIADRDGLAGLLRAAPEL